MPEFYMISARKMPEFYITIARKIFFPEFGGHVPSSAPPVSYAYGLCCGALCWKWAYSGPDEDPVRS